MQIMGSNNNSVNPAFSGKLQLTNTANKLLERKVKEAFADKAYEKLIRDIVNSDCDVYITHSKNNKLQAEVTMHNKKEVLAKAVAGQERNPLSFIHKAFSEAKNIWF